MDSKKLELENKARETAIMELEAERTAEIQNMLERQESLKTKEEALRAEIASLKSGKQPAPDALFRNKTQVSAWLVKQGLKPTSPEYKAMYKRYSEGLPIQ